jgi:hypothetical protein
MRSYLKYPIYFDLKSLYLAARNCPRREIPAFNKYHPRMLGLCRFLSIHIPNINYLTLRIQRSILIEDSGKAVIAGFGWAQFGRVLDKHFESDNWAVVATRSVAPELFKGGPNFQTSASDVYAFGCVCIQVGNERYCFENF